MTSKKMSDPQKEGDPAPTAGSAYHFIPDLKGIMSEIAADTIISRTFYTDGQVKGILFGFAAGQELSEHTAAKPAILHFLAGEAQLTLGEDELEARPGTWVHMPAHLPHSVVAQTQVVMLLLLLH
jgi:quercetin dioxygenase-like cupin family protein